MIKNNLNTPLEIKLENTKYLESKKKIDEIVQSYASSGKFKKIKSLGNEQERYSKEITNSMAKYLLFENVKIDVRNYCGEIMTRHTCNFMMDLFDQWDNISSSKKIIVEAQKIASTILGDLNKELNTTANSIKDKEEARYYYQVIKLDFNSAPRVKKQSILEIYLQLEVVLHADNKQGSAITEIDESKNSDIADFKANLINLVTSTSTRVLTNNQFAKSLIKARELNQQELATNRFQPFLEDFQTIMRNDPGKKKLNQP